MESAAADVFRLERVGRTFQTVFDWGLFHTFDRDERPRYAASIAAATEPGGILYVLSFSDEGPVTGPHPVSRDELTAAFDGGSGWSVAAMEPERIETRFHDAGASAWLAAVTKIASRF